MNRLFQILMLCILCVGCSPAIPGSYKVPRPADEEDLAYGALELMWEHVELYEDEETYEHTLAPATPGQKAVFACQLYLGEVNNGGHEQFFWNGSGIVWEEALEGLRLLNAPEHEKILTQALDSFPVRRPFKEREVRQLQLEQMDANLLDQLDKQFYESKEDLDQLILDYINAHPDEFFEAN